MCLVLCLVCVSAVETLRGVEGSVGKILPYVVIE